MKIKLHISKQKLKRMRMLAVLACALVLLSAVVIGHAGINVNESIDPEAVAANSADSYAEPVADELTEEQTLTEPGAEVPADDQQSPQEKEPSEPTGDGTGSGQTDPGTPGQTTDGTGTVSDKPATDPTGSQPADPVTGSTVTDTTQVPTDTGKSSDQQTTGAPAAEPIEPAVPAEKTEPKKNDTKHKAVVDTSKTDADADKAPDDLALAITDADTAAVLSAPNSPLDASEVTGSRHRQSGKYGAYLQRVYQVSFAPDFAIVMEEIENAYEFEHGLISQKTYQMRSDNLEKGVLFALDASSALAKYAHGDELLYFSTDEVELLSDESRAEEEIASESTIATYHYTNWGDVLAVYILRQKQAGAEEIILNDHARTALAAVFDDMNQVEVIDRDNCIARFTARTIEDYLADKQTQGADTEKLRSQLTRYTGPEFLLLAAAESGSRQLTLAAYDAMESDDEKQAISAERKNVVLAAQTLNGKIHYFWGGKYNHLGWNKSWATPKTVSSAGSSSTGSVRLHGLDCSGFVSWAFINGFDTTDVNPLLGQGTASQWVTSEPVSEEEAQVGDLVFLRAPSAGGINHVGILVGRDADGNWMAIHCNAGDDNVVVERAYDAGFRYIRRPLLYQD